MVNYRLHLLHRWTEMGNMSDKIEIYRRHDVFVNVNNNETKEKHTQANTPLKDERR